MNNKKIAKIFYEIANLLEIKGTSFYRINAYRKAASYLDSLKIDVAETRAPVTTGARPSTQIKNLSAQVYKKKKINALRVKGIIGEKIAEKIVEFIKTGKIKYYDELKEETAIRQLITYYFQTKGLSLKELKENAKKRKIVYSRFTKPAKQLLELAGSIEKAKETLKKVADWAKSRNLDYAIETVFKKWLELDRLKPKEIVKKPFYRGDPMVWSETKRKWYVISPQGDWLEFVGKEGEVEWKIIR